MKNLYDNTKLFLIGKIKTEQYVKFLRYIGNEVQKMASGSGYKSLSYLKTAQDAIEYIADADEEENKLRLKALLCDIFNNFAHALNQNKRNITSLSQTGISILFGMKKAMVIDIIKECKEFGNKSYGLARDDLGREVFAVDIPMCGQISWHFPPCQLTSKQYDFTLENKSVELTNMCFLSGNLKQSEIDKVSKHLRTVIQSQDISELNYMLYGKLLDLSEFVNEPSEKDLKCLENLNKKVEIGERIEK